MEWFFELDGNILLYIQEYLRSDFMTPIWKFITALGNAGWFWILLTIILLIPKKTRRIGVASAIALFIGSLITNVALKNIVARTRPYEVVEGLNLLVGKAHDFSFPSGHSCASFASAFAIYKTAPKKYGIAALILASLIAFSRLYVGIHYPTDVIAGIIIGIVSAVISVLIIKKYEDKKSLKN